MSIDLVDTDASSAEAARQGSGYEAWVPELSVTETWQESSSSGALLRRQVVFVPSLDPWESVDSARAAVRAGAPGVLRLNLRSTKGALPLTEWALDPLPAVCEREGYALALDYGPTGTVPLTELAAFACSAPEVALLVLGDRVCEQPAVWRLLDCCPNVLLQVTDQTAPASLAAGVGTFGAHRFVFGSRGSATGADAVLLAALEADDQVALTSGNARALDTLEWRQRWL
ncbi:hypothetical protein ABH922_005517 [Rhodococcus sp. 27YEA15]|uniref:hypothetical protein n=1 Tax=Rhodococcus sp. 27YEA15 TaxID=3156259 RepID=UPI003C7ABE5C